MRMVKIWITFNGENYWLRQYPGSYSAQSSHWRLNHGKCLTNSQAFFCVIFLLNYSFSLPCGCSGDLVQGIDMDDVVWYTTSKSRDTQMPWAFTLHSNIPSDESHGVKVALDFFVLFFWVHIIFSLLRGGSVSSASSSLTLDNMRCIGYTRGTLNTEVKLWLRLSRSNSQAPAETAVPVSQSANSHAGTGEAVSTASAATPSLARPTNWVSAGTLVAVSLSAPTACARMRPAADAVAPTLGNQHPRTKVPSQRRCFFLS